MTRSSSYRLLGALESPSNDPLFRALCYQPFGEEHRGRWPPVLLFHVSRFDRDKRDRALTRRCRTIAFRSMFLHDVDTSYVEYAYIACVFAIDALSGSYRFPYRFRRTNRFHRSSASRLPIGGRGIAVGRALSRSNTTVVRECPRRRWIAWTG